MCEAEGKPRGVVRVPHHHRENALLRRGLALPARQRIASFDAKKSPPDVLAIGILERVEGEDRRPAKLASVELGLVHDTCAHQGDPIRGQRPRSDVDLGQADALAQLDHGRAARELIVEPLFERGLVDNERRNGSMGKITHRVTERSVRAIAMTTPATATVLTVDSREAVEKGG